MCSGSRAKVGLICGGEDDDRAGQGWVELRWAECKRDLGSSAACSSTLDHMQQKVRWFSREFIFANNSECLKVFGERTKAGAGSNKVEMNLVAAGDTGRSTTKVRFVDSRSRGSSPTGTAPGMRVKTKEKKEIWHQKTFGRRIGLTNKIPQMGSWMPKKSLSLP